MSNMIIVVLFGLLVIATLYCWFVDWRKKRLLYSIKLSINSVFPVAWLIIGVYTLVFLMILGLVPLNNYVLERLGTYQGESDWVYRMMPFVYIFVMFYLSWLLFIKPLNKPLLKYTEQELVWQKESNDRAKVRLYKMLPFLIKFQRKELK